MVTHLLVSAELLTRASRKRISEMPSSMPGKSPTGFRSPFWLAMMASAKAR